MEEQTIDIQMGEQITNILDSISEILNEYSNYIPMAQLDYDFYSNLKLLNGYESFDPSYEDYCRLEAIYCSLLNFVQNNKKG